MNHKNILLVEGEADRGFFEALCRHLSLAVSVKVTTAKDAGQYKNSKQAALAAVQTLYLSQLADAQIERLAIIIDADRAADGGGYDIGAWVMPDNANDGMLEDWVQGNLHPNEAALMQHAKASIDRIPGSPKFKPIRRPKAEVATWLAWQEAPDHGLWQAAKPGLLDESAPQYAALKKWLEKIFAAA